MVVFLSKESEIAEVNKIINRSGLTAFLVKGSPNRLIFQKKVDLKEVCPELLKYIDDIRYAKESYKLIESGVNESSALIKVGDTFIGREHFKVIAGPCAIEGRGMIDETASFLREIGVKIMRGGCYKPRTSPYKFQGLKEEGVRLMYQAAKRNGLLMVTEAIDLESLEQITPYTDIIQIGARNMQNFSLLKAVGKTEKPVILKRGLSASIEEWLSSGEYIASEGNNQIILCERGIKTFEDSVRYSLDISSIPVLKDKTDLPIILDPSHAAGDFKYVGALAKGGVGAGCDGLLIEVHPNPKEALCDSKQQLSFKEFKKLFEEIVEIRKSLSN